MPSTGWWLLDLGAAAVALVAILGAAVKVGQVLRAVWRTINRLNEVADDLLGDKAKGIPSMKDRVTAIEKFQREDLRSVHSAWHLEEPQPYANGPVPPRRRR